MLNVLYALLSYIFDNVTETKLVSDVKRLFEAEKKNNSLLYVT